MLSPQFWRLEMESQEHDLKVTVWDLLTVISFFMPVAGVLNKHPNQVNVGVLAYALAVMAGISLGIGFAASMRYALLAIVGRISKFSDRVQMLIGIAMLLAALVWVVFANIVGDWVAHKTFNSLA